ncbi:YpfB family protein [Metabacillus fastidiosus]|uniref:YpfB family protein n=1 Tax=Metabacillus fastidiosus TaxID=1458 RepID=UPI003D26C161
MLEFEKGVLLLVKAWIKTIGDEWMKRFEGILIKLLVIHFIILICSQLIIQEPKIQPYLSRVVKYEGVNKITISEWLETFSQ